MEEEQGVPIRLARMNPISTDNKLPPGIRVQKTMYEFLDPPAKKDRGIIILGAYRPPAQNSELAAALDFFGFGPIRHPEFCPDFESFRQMSQSAASLLLRPEGRAAAEDLSSRLNIPCNRSFMAFDKDAVLEQYRGLFAFLENLDVPGKSGNPGARGKAESFLAAAREKAEEREEQARALLGDARLAVDSTATIAPFNLALALVKAGLKVCRIYTNQLPDFEKPSLAELARIRGDIRVINPNHVRKYGPRPAEPLADIAVGFEAGYATAAPVTVPLAFDEQLFGFEGYSRVLDDLIQFAGKGTSDLRQLVKDYGLVV
jgi:nitrogenase molybdenum-cofactor synthesis protein NifE